jgi:putative phage-type endonuclease
MLLKEVENLTNIIDEITQDDISSIFTEEFSLELTETIFHLIETYIEDNPTAISEPDFHDELLDELKELLISQFDGDIFFNEDDEEDLDIIIDYAIEIYFTTFSISRSFDTNIETNTITNEKNAEIENKLNKLRKKPQPVQRTPEWYTFRHNLITASNAYKVFESQASINQIIYEKCQPLKFDFFKNDKNDKNSENIVNQNIDTKTMVNVNTTLHWGQKYEPLSVMMYEHMYNSKVEDFGCIEHPVYKFIGASPDGIVIQSNTGRYGRMLEIKNIVNREINGIPKKEYWIQMQLQMEVCDLDECDFLETKFIEYPDYQSSRNDSSLASFNGEEFNSYVTTKDGSYKGIIVHFHTSDGSPHYEYMPLHLWTPDDISNWEETTVQKYESEPYKYTFIKFIYWKLEKLSCVLVLRNREWFKNNVGQLEKVWKIIEEERVTGFEHRAPVRRQKKEQPIYKPYTGEDTCFLKVVKL